MGSVEVLTISISGLPNIGGGVVGEPMEVGVRNDFLDELRECQKTRV